MDKNSLLYQLMAMRMNGIMNDVAERDEDYQASLSTVDPYIDQLKALQLPTETKQLIAMQKILGCNYDDFFQPC